jgi:hypothetical protein
LRFAIGFCLAAAALLPLGFAHAQTDPADDSLRLYAVNIVQDPPQPWPGYGIYLGKGLPPPTLWVRPPTPSRASTSLAWSCPRPPLGRAMSSEWI